MRKGQAVEANGPKGVTKVVNNVESSSKGICQKLLLVSNFINTLLSPSVARLSHQQRPWDEFRAAPLCSMVSGLLRSVHWVGERIKARASLCGDSNRRNNTLSKHRSNFIPHFMQQWVRYFPWVVERNWLYIWVELDLIFGFQFSQTTEKMLQ